jgi:hypothetical protein
MRSFLIGLCLAGLVAVTGCKSTRRPAVPPPVVTLDLALQGKVKSVNPKARFAILSFPIGRLPKLEQRLNVYRAGTRVGEVKVTGPQMDWSIAADVMSGDAQSGDEVREN